MNTITALLERGRAVDSRRRPDGTWRHESARPVGPAAQTERPPYGDLPGYGETDHYPSV